MGEKLFLASLVYDNRFLTSACKSEGYLFLFFGGEWEMYSILKQWQLHFQSLNTIFSWALLHGFWFCDHLHIWSQWINTPKTHGTSSILYFKRLLEAFSHQFSIMDLIKISRMSPHPLPLCSWNVGGSVTLGYFPFDCNGTPCLASPCGLSLEGLPKAWINERLWTGRVRTQLLQGVNACLSGNNLCIQTQL